MKRISVAFVFLLLVLVAVFYRNRMASHPTALPRSEQGVVLLTIRNFDVGELADTAEMPHFATLARQNPIGLLPTRNGTADESDVSAAFRVLLAGSRTPKPDAPILTNIVRGKWITAPATTPQIITAVHRAKAGSVVSATYNIGEGSSRRNFDATLAKLTAKRDGLPDGWSLLIVGVTPTLEAIARRERVSPVLLWQYGTVYSVPPLLTSPSVRNRPGLVASTDIAATVAALLGLPIEQQHIGDGRAMETVSSSKDRISYLIYQSTAWGMQAREQKLLPVLPWFLAALLLISVFAPWEALQRVTCNAALITPVAIIAVALLIPDSMVIPSWLIYAIAALPVIAIPLFVRSNHLPVWIAAATMSLLVGDTILGGPMLSRTPLSYSVLEAARYYGIGNEVSGLLLGASVIVVGYYLFSSSLPGRIAVALSGFALAILSGAPMLGADAGGFVATLAAFAALALTPETRQRINIKAFITVVLVGSVILGGVIAFALWDAGRGATERTHIGEAVAAMQTRGIGAVTSIVQRKVAVNARLLVTSPWAVLFAMEVVLVLRALQKKQQVRQPLAASPVNAFPFIVGLFAASLALFLLNDSGTVAAATCGIWFFAIKGGSLPSPEYRR